MIPICGPESICGLKVKATGVDPLQTITELAAHKSRLWFRAGLLQTLLRPHEINSGLQIC